MTLIGQQGFRATSLRAIGRALGVQPAQLLHYFASREELLETVLTRWDAASEQILTDDGRGFLDVWPQIVRANTRVPGFVNLYTSLAAEATDPGHPSHDFFRQRFHRVRTLIAADIHQRQATGQIGGDLDPERAALHLVAFSDGLQLQWLIDRTIDLATELTHEIARL